MGCKMIHPVLGTQLFVFSPLCEVTTRFDQCLGVPVRITLFQLIEEGWEFI